MIKIDKLYSTLKKESLFLAVSGLFFVLIFWYQISPITFKDYDARCRGNYGQTDDYTRCMNPHWSQYNLNKMELIISLGLSGIFLSLFIINQRSRKQS